MQTVQSVYTGNHELVDSVDTPVTLEPLALTIMPAFTPSVLGLCISDAMFAAANLGAADESRCSTPTSNVGSRYTYTPPQTIEELDLEELEVVHLLRKPKSYGFEEDAAKTVTDGLSRLHLRNLRD